jgi:chromosome segregation ATPase
MRKPEMVAHVVRRIYSPKHQRERLFVDGDDYAEKSRVVRKQLNLARRTCQSINDSHESLFEELQEFKRKLSRHSVRKDDERAFVSESRGALKDFHNRLEHIRKMRASGRDSPDTVDAVERALEEAWEEFDSVRRVMLANLTILNDAKEELMRERMLEEEESDEGHIRSLARMMYEIRDREHDKTEQALESLRSRRYVHGARSGYGY